MDLLGSKQAKLNLKQRLALSCSPDDVNAVFSTEDVNRVFVWQDLKRVGLVEAILQTDAQSGASSDKEGVQCVPILKLVPSFDLRVPKTAYESKYIACILHAGPGTPQQQPEPQDARPSAADGMLVLLLFLLRHAYDHISNLPNSSIVHPKT